MPDETQAQPPHEQSFDNLLARYIAGEEAGSAPDRQEFLRQHPQHAADLREFFANRDQMQRLAEPLRGNSAPGRSSAPLGQLRYFGDYELLEEVAVGGMGIVYKARQVSLNRIVAVKMILKGTLARDEDVKRFRAEAEAAASLQHPAIVAIHEVGLHEGQHYFSMDFVEGHSLAELPREQPLSARQAAAYVRDAAEAVHYAHQQGTLHRDLKPSNILIDRHSRVRITDFGLAKRIEGNSELTLTGQILGTPSYMPPEQASGKHSLISAASDIYSLGAVLYELLTGRPPFRGESPVETLRQVETLDPVSPRLLNPAAPRDLETICLKCLEKEPHKRYGTAQLLADDLNRYLRGELIVARPIRPWQRVAKWIRRHPAAAGFVAASTLAVLAIVGLIVGQSYNARLETLNAQLASAKTSLETRNEQLSGTNSALQTAKQHLEVTNDELNSASGRLAKALDDVKAERSRASRYLYAARMALVQRAEREEQSGRVIQLLRSVIPESANQEDLRDFEWYFLWRKHHGEESLLRGHSSPVSAVCLSPDNQRLASGSTDGTIRLWNVSDGQVFRTFVCPAGSVNAIRFLSDGKQVGVRADKDAVFVWEMDSGELVRPSAEQSAALVEDDTKIVGPALGTAKKAISGDRIRSVISRTSYGSTEIKSTITVAGTNAGTILSRDLPTGVTQVAMNDDGELLAVACLDQDVRIWEAQGREIITLHAGSEVRSLAFSSDTSRLVAGNEDGTIMLWSLPGQQMRTLHEGTGQATCVSFGAGGRLLAAVAGQALVWEVATGKRVNSLPVASDGRSHGSHYRRIALSPTSGWVAGIAPGSMVDAISGHQVTKLSSSYGYGYVFSSDESLVAEAWLRNVTVWNTVTGVAVHSFKVPQYAAAVAFSPDTRLLAAGTGTQQVFQLGTLQVWNAATGQSVLNQGVPLGVWGLAFSPDGKLLAAAMGNYGDRGANVGRICIWDTATWRIVQDLRGHTGCVWSVAFNSAGSRLVSAAGHWSGSNPISRGAASKAVLPDAKSASQSGLKMAPGEVIVWDVATGHELLILPDEQGGMYGAAFSPDGSHLATASKLGAICLLDGTPLAQAPTHQPLPEGPIAVATTPTKPDAKLTPRGSTLPPYPDPARAAAAAFSSRPIIKKAPPTPPVNNAGQFSQQRRWPEAIMEYSKIIALQPDHQGAWRGRAWAQFNLRQWDHAIADFQGVLQLQPYDAWAIAITASCLLNKGELDAAVTEYEKALQLEPYRAASHYELGLTFAAKQDWEQAVAAYSAAIELDAKYQSAWRNRAWASFKLRRWEEAIADFREALRLKPNDTWAQASLGIALRNQRQLDASITEFEKAIRLDPKRAESHYGLGLTLAAKGSWENASFAHQEAVRLKPDYYDAFNALGTALRRQERFEAAILAYQAAIRLRLDLPQAHNNLAWLLATCPDVRFRDSERAVDSAEKATILSPQLATYWNTLGVAQYRSGDWQKAVVTLRKSEEITSGSTSFVYNAFFLGMSYWQLGDQDQARQWHEQAARWIEKNKESLEKDVRAEEIGAVEAEAAELLGIQSPAR